MCAVKDPFPLHFIVFKQTASAIPHEANVERLFSRSGLLIIDNEAIQGGRQGCTRGRIEL